MIEKQKKRSGRPKKAIPEKMRFGIKCTEAEKNEVIEKFLLESHQAGKRITVSDFFLRHIGVRK